MTQKGSKKNKGIPRKIIFYKLHCVEKVKENGEELEKPRNFTASTWFNHIDTLQALSDDFSPQSQYLRQSGQPNILAAYVDNLPAPQRVCFAKIRKDAFPLLERNGKLTRLNIGADDGLAEPCHMVFFDGDVVGVESNFHGPSMSMLAQYLTKKAPSSSPYEVRYRALIEREQLKKLKEIVKGRRLVIKVHRSYVSRLEKAMKKIGAAFALLDNTSSESAETLMLELSMGRAPRKEKLVDDLLEECKNLAKDDQYLEDSAKNMLLQFKVEGYKNQRKKVVANMLEDRLIQEYHFARLNDDTRAVDPDAVYAKIEELFNDDEFKKRIKSAMEIE